MRPRICQMPMSCGNVYRIVGFVSELVEYFLLFHCGSISIVDFQRNRTSKVGKSVHICECISISGNTDQILIDSYTTSK